METTFLKQVLTNHEQLHSLLTILTLKLFITKTNNLILNLTILVSKRETGQWLLFKTYLISSRNQISLNLNGCPSKYEFYSIVQLSKHFLMQRYR